MLFLLFSVCFSIFWCLYYFVPSKPNPNDDDGLTEKLIIEPELELATFYNPTNDVRRIQALERLLSIKKISDQLVESDQDQDSIPTVVDVDVHRNPTPQSNSPSDGNPDTPAFTRESSSETQVSSKRKKEFLKKEPHDQQTNPLTKSMSRIIDLELTSSDESVDKPPSQTPRNDQFPLTVKAFDQPTTSKQALATMQSVPSGKWAWKRRNTQLELLKDFDAEIQNSCEFFEASDFESLTNMRVTINNRVPKEK